MGKAPCSHLIKSGKTMRITKISSDLDTGRRPKLKFDERFYEKYPKNLSPFGHLVLTDKREREMWKYRLVHQSKPREGENYLSNHTECM